MTKKKMGMIETLEDLRDEFLMWKLPRTVAGNSLAMEAWEQALSRPSKVNIWKFYCMAGMIFNERPILWSEIEDDD